MVKNHTNDNNSTTPETKLKISAVLDLKIFLHLHLTKLEQAQILLNKSVQIFLVKTNVEISPLSSIIRVCWNWNVVNILYSVKWNNLKPKIQQEVVSLAIVNALKHNIALHFEINDIMRGNKTQWHCTYYRPVQEINSPKLA